MPSKPASSPTSGAWNGVDYSEFTEVQKKKVRAHYAALVKQIDHEVGAILDALKETGQLENTVIIFASDHGDHLGDHNLIGKGDFYQSSIKVPLLVRLPGATGGAVCDDLVSIEDITATLLQLGGCPLPDYLDSIPLPLPSSPLQSPRQSIFGFLANGCMHFDGEWKLVKYTSGATLLFNLLEDPKEQHNRIDDPACLPVYRRLDAELTGQILNSIHAGHAEKKVAHNLLFNDEEFGQKGWHRSYPQAVGPS
jgi:arylsulfatase A-like enzyme